MEITKEVLVKTDNLISNCELEIIYSGKLKDSKDIFINYGYTPNSFEYTKIKLDDNNSTKIKLSQPGYFYFFFDNESGEKDNNQNKDFQLYIKSSNLIITDNSSMKELSYRFFSSQNQMYKTFYTSHSIKNTSKPQEIIIPKAFDSQGKTSESKIKNGYCLAEIKPVVEFNVTQALIPTENISMVSSILKPRKEFFATKIIRSINKLLLSIPKSFEKE